MSALTFFENTRVTKETNISIRLAFSDEILPDTSSEQALTIDSPVPFLTHMLTAMLFHGGWVGYINASGDVEVDEHHLVEDVGIVLGQIFSEYALTTQPVARFGHAIIPMDDSLAECTVDFSNRAFLSYRANFPQAKIGSFDVSLAREFFTAFAHNARINLHIESRYGINSHHILEAMYKSFGIATRRALQASTAVQSTKGEL